MKRTERWLAAGTFTVIYSLVAGCAKPSTPAAAPASQPAADAEAEIQNALAELSDDDRKLALAQKICPLSLSRLGSMGAPVKVNVQGQDVFICCTGCQKELESEAEKYLAELEKIKADPDKYAAEHKSAP